VEPYIRRASGAQPPRVGGGLPAGATSPPLARCGPALARAANDHHQPTSTTRMWQQQYLYKVPTRGHLADRREFEPKKIAVRVVAGRGAAKPG